MNNIKDDIYYATKIRDDFRFIINNTKSLTKEQISKNEILIDSIMFRLIQISENSLKLSESFKAKFNNIPWYAIKGLRNRIVHDYGNVDYTVVYDTIKNEIPHCIEELNKIIK